MHAKTRRIRVFCKYFDALQALALSRRAKCASGATFLDRQGVQAYFDLSNRFFKVFSMFFRMMCMCMCCRITQSRISNFRDGDAAYLPARHQR